ncbi:protein GrpE [Panicum miliaceum]|uniref:GrpE protein homolog n=1 Tax=Panicum miliaceum TaxID=4540 RepID=A0A3L6Q566_PANMI|nr:protein GrpE [Panicum miliaceum]
MAATFFAGPAASAAANPSSAGRRLQNPAPASVLQARWRPSRGASASLFLRRPNAGLRPLRVAAGAGAGVDPKIVNGEEVPTMKDLIQLYKTAFLDGNDEVLGEVEKAITALEKEKGRVASQFESVTAEITSGKEKFIRLNADLENFRKQSEKERAKFTSNIQVEVVQSLLPLVDSFEKTNLENTPETEKEQKISTSYQGIYKQLVETLRYLGVGIVETVGKPFDPSVHEAIAREESSQFKAGIVSHEVRRGFLLKERLLRPATVKVSTGSGKQSVSSVEAAKDAAV